MIEKITLDGSTTIELALPKGGFSENFMSAVRGKLAECEELDSVYLLLKKVGEDVAVFFCFIFRNGIAPATADARIARCMEEISSLFSDEIALDATCLNGKAELLATVRSVAEPVFRR